MSENAGEVPTTSTIKIKKWLVEKFSYLLIAGAFALAGVFVERYSDHIQAWVRTVFVGGIGGTYVVKSWTYPPTPPYELVPWQRTIDLKDTGRTVFGVTKSVDSGSQYELFGYHRMKFLMMAFGGEGPLGGGTLTMQMEVASGPSRLSPVFWGWETSAECVGDEGFYLQCPAVMYMQGAQNPEEPYKHFLDPKNCRKVTNNKPPELCAALKAR